MSDKKTVTEAEALAITIKFYQELDVKFKTLQSKLDKAVEALELFVEDMSNTMPIIRDETISYARETLNQIKEGE